MSEPTDQDQSAKPRPKGELTTEYGVREAWLPPDAQSLVLTEEEADILSKTSTGQDFTYHPIRKLTNQFTEERKQRYCELLARYGVQYKCARAVGVSPQTVKNHKKTDPVFAARVKEALEIFEDVVEEIFLDRALHGWKEPVYSQRLGIKIGEVQKYSDRLMELAIKKHRPDYREKQQMDVNVSGGVLVAPISTQQLSSDEAQSTPYDTWRNQFAEQPTKELPPAQPPETMDNTEPQETKPEWNTAQENPSPPE